MDEDLTRREALLNWRRRFRASGVTAAACGVSVYLVSVCAVAGFSELAINDSLVEVLIGIVTFCALVLAGAIGVTKPQSHAVHTSSLFLLVANLVGLAAFCAVVVWQETGMARGFGLLVAVALLLFNCALIATASLVVAFAAATVVAVHQRIKAREIR